MVVTIEDEDLPTMIIDPSDRRLFTLFKLSADKGMSEEGFPELYAELDKKGKLLCFVHNHNAGKVYVAFPDKDYFNDVFNT